ncbi:MAG: glycosyltransferase, partial [Candidatus Sumerlaeota bacterium]|nr:glycosyltransferase [Candidatus Sumerlaeota bacterium]
MADSALSICFVSREWPPAPCGGIGTYLQTIVPLLSARGHSVHVLTEWVEGAAKEEESGAVHVHRILFLNPRRPARLHPRLDARPECRALAQQRDFVSVFALAAAERLRRLARETRIDVAEAPEFEAPLGFLQTTECLAGERPALPCLIHLHTPSRRVDQFNHDDAHSPAALYRYQNEDMSIALADALVCGSRFLARDTEERLGLEAGAVRVIPLPLGRIPDLVAQAFQPARGPEMPEAPGNTGWKACATNTGGKACATDRQPRTILYAGRLERRKGVDLFVEACLALRRDYPDLKVRLIGGDTLLAPFRRPMSEFLKKKIPREAAGAFEFIPAVPREQLWEDYAAATVCCDGRSGLLCDADHAGALAAALRRALEMPDEARAEMGRAARERILAFCNDERNLEARIDLYRETIERARQRSPRVPAFLPFPESPLRAEHPKRADALRRVRPAGRSRIAVAIPCYNLGQYLDTCVESVLAQTRAADEIVIVDDGSTDRGARERLGAWNGRRGVRVVSIPNSGLAAARNTGAAHTSSEYLLFLDADDALRPACLERTARVLDAHPEVGAVSPWAERFGESRDAWALPHGQFPHLLAENTLIACSL